MNLYAYVHNAPTGYRDPWGLCSEQMCHGSITNYQYQGWFVQLGVVGSAGAAIQGGGDGGIYFGSSSSGGFTSGTYVTGTASVTSSAGGDGGFILSLGDRHTESIAGTSLGANLGVDTPVGDIMVGTEALVDGGQVLNLTLTVGPEVSAGVLLGAETTANETFIYETPPGNPSDQGQFGRNQSNGFADSDPTDAKK